MEKKIDKTLHCQICSKDFIWTGKEQAHFDDMVATGRWKVSTPPTRCPECRCRRIPMRAGSYINTEAISEFVDEIETRKGYKKRPDLILRHILEEVGECSAALWKFEEESEFAAVMSKPPDPARVARELVDIIFLCVWEAHVMGVDLNEAVRWRMKEVAKQYGIDDREVSSK